MNNIENLKNEQSEFNKQLKYSKLVLTLGILSISMCWCYAFVGIIFSIVAIILTKKAKQEYFLNQKQYTLKSFKNLKTGYFCSIIGLIISCLYLIFVTLYLLFYKSAISTAFSSMPWDLFNK